MSHYQKQAIQKMTADRMDFLSSLSPKQRALLLSTFQKAGTGYGVTAPLSVLCLTRLALHRRMFAFLSEDDARDCVVALQLCRRLEPQALQYADVLLAQYGNVPSKQWAGGAKV